MLLWEISSGAASLVSLISSESLTRDYILNYLKVKNKHPTIVGTPWGYEKLYTGIDFHNIYDAYWKFYNKLKHPRIQKLLLLLVIFVITHDIHYVPIVFIRLFAINRKSSSKLWSSP